MVASGQEGDREGLRSRAAEFDATLVVLQQGGRVLDVEVAPAPPEVRAVLGAVADLCGIPKPDLDLVAVGPRNQPGFQAAYRRIEARIDDLQVRSQDVTVIFEARTERLRRHMLQALILLGGFVRLIFAVGLWLTRRYIVGPVTRLDEAARRIGDGDFSQRVDITTQDERATLAGTFNQMTAQVEQLLESLNLRSQHTTPSSRAFLWGFWCCDPWRGAPRDWHMPAEDNPREASAPTGAHSLTAQPSSAMDRLDP